MTTLMAQCPLTFTLNIRKEIDMNIEYFGAYRVDAEFVEHGCCWDSAIVRDCTKGRGMYGKGVALICECDADMAEAICAALNATLKP